MRDPPYDFDSRESSNRRRAPISSKRRAMLREAIEEYYNAGDENSEDSDYNEYPILRAIKRK